MRHKLFPILSFLFFALLMALVIWAGGTGVSEGTGLPGVITKKPRPTPTPSLPLHGKGIQSLEDVTKLTPFPDLIVESIKVDPPTPLISTSCLISVTVMNIGSADVSAGNNFFVDLYMDPEVPPQDLRSITGVYSWSAQGIDFPQGGRKTFTVTAVFTEPYEHQLYAQVDSPESGLSWYGNVNEGDESNNVFPASGPGVKVAAQPHYSITQGSNLDFHDNYASSVEVVGCNEVHQFTDLYGRPVTSDATLRLGIFEEPPVNWGTWSAPPDFASDDYNLLYPDFRVNAVITNDQLNPKIATAPISASHKVVVVWEDRRWNKKLPDIYLRWAMDEVADSPDCPQHKRLDWGTGPAGTPGSHEILVNEDGPGDAVHTAPVVAVSANGSVIVAWQDNRNGKGDIYFQQFRFNDVTHQLDKIGNNRRLDPPPGCENTDLRNPKIGQLLDNRFVLVWEGKCPESHANIWLARTRPVTTTELTWDLWRIVNGPDAQSATNPDLGLSYAWTVGEIGEPYWNPITMRWEAPYTPTRKPWIAVVWEGITYTQGVTKPAVLASLSLDAGDTFQKDIEISDNRETLPFRKTADQPVIFFGQDKRDVEINIGGMQVTLPAAPVPMAHFAWRDFRNSTGLEDGWPQGNNPDIRYRNCNFPPEDNPPHPPTLDNSACAPSVQLNFCDTFPWQKKPAKQTNPTIAGWNYETTEDRFKYSDVYVAWADNRNYYDNDNANNYDIYMAIPYADAAPPYLTDHNINLNDEAKVHFFDTKVITDRTPDRPPAARQDRPSLAVNAYHLPKSDDWGMQPLGGTFETGWLYLVWMDTRDIRDKTYPNSWDVYFARSNLTYYANNDLHAFGENCRADTFPCDRYGAGSYISKAFDAGSTNARWYSIWYQGSKDPYAPPPFLQTRVADTITALLSAPWWPQTSAITQGCQYPVWGYIDSGADIYSGTQKWPQGRYFQYRANFWTADFGSGKTPELYWVRAYYDFPSTAGWIGPTPTPIMSPVGFLPMIMKQKSSD